MTLPADSLSKDLPASQRASDVRRPRRVGVCVCVDGSISGDEIGSEIAIYIVEQRAD